jgi:hypothetical protein
VNAESNELPGDLGRALHALDAEAARRAGRVDADAVAAKVLARLREEPERVSVVRRLRWAVPAAPGWLRVTAAAAMVVVVAGSVVRKVVRPGVGRTVAVPVVAVMLDSLNAKQLESLLQVTAEVRPVATGVEPVSGSWDDLSESQLRAVLQAVQQVQGETL